MHLFWAMRVSAGIWWYGMYQHWDVVTIC
ncbi:hypothetical protein RJ641_011815 [Dillenia turbinata]|uniref:Uncharacterized protein n=1 Tax=Dillenia turbinata TaxID=194707 RepID=A0AAN8V4K9_9MAGN